MELQNPLNGFVRLETSRYVLLADVWLSKGIFDNSWVPYPAIRDPARHLAGATHCFISHIHEDHYDLKAIEKLDRRVIMLVPDVYPNQLIRATLSAMGFGDVRMLAPGHPEEVSPELTLEVVGRMNAYGQELERYGEADGVSLVIDTGLLVQTDGLKVALLADNVPYDPEAAGGSLERMKGCDLLGISYNGAASDYPLCYDSLSDDDKRAVATEREDKRESANRALIEAVKPGALLLYSSEFALQGPRAMEFARWCDGSWWANKMSAVTRYEKLGLPAYGLYEDDVLRLEIGGGEGLERRSLSPPPLLDFERELHSAIPNPRERFEPVSGLASISTLSERSAEHMFAKMDQIGLASDWVVRIELDDEGWEPLFIDFSSRKLGGERPRDRKLLTCRCEANYLAAILQGRSHWNNAMISFNLSWARVPNVYDRPLYDALNFFHVPRGVAPAS